MNAKTKKLWQVFVAKSRRADIFEQRRWNRLYSN